METVIYFSVPTKPTLYYQLTITYMFYTFDIYYLYNLIIFPTFRSLFRGEPAVCLSSPAGESLQLPGTLLPPTAYHCCLSGTFSVHDDKVNKPYFTVIYILLCYTHLVKMLCFYVYIMEHSELSGRPWRRAREVTRDRGDGSLILTEPHPSPVHYKTNAAI